MVVCMRDAGAGYRAEAVGGEEDGIDRATGHGQVSSLASVKANHGLHN